MSSAGQFQTPEPRRLLDEYGVTPERGFVKPGFDTIWDAAVTEAEQLFQRDLSSPTAPELQYIEAVALWIDTAFDQLEALYYAAYYDHATGRQLDSLLSIVGFKRQGERQARGEVTFFATDNSAASDIVIPAGTTVRTPGDESAPPIYFRTTEPATIAAGTASVSEVPIRGVDPELTTLSLTDEQRGMETNVGANEITELHDSIRGIPTSDGVTNPLPTGTTGTRLSGDRYRFVRGRDRETDLAFKRRYENETFGMGTATVEAIEAALRAAGDGETVLAARVDEELEITAEPDGSGGTIYSGRQIEPVVVLSEDTPTNRDFVAQAIYDSRAAGIESVGAHSGTAITSNEEEYTTGLGFDIATDVPLYIDATIDVTDSFPVDGVTRIKTNLIETIGGVVGDDTRIQGLDIGEDVEYWDVVADIIDRDIPGLEGPEGTVPSESIFLGTSPSPTEVGDVTIAADQVALLDPDNVTITTNLI